MEIKKTASNKTLSLINNDKNDSCRNVKDIGNLEEHLICHSVAFYLKTVKFNIQRTVAFTFQSETMPWRRKKDK